MKLALYTIGRLKAGPELDLAQNYQSRICQLGRNCGFTGFEIIEIGESQRPQAAQRKAQEAEKLLARIPARAVRIILSEKGDDLTSADLAKALQNQANSGLGELAFVIGGPDGLDERVTEQAWRQMAFGRQTWPHRLVCIMLCEQIYRSITILLNHPYHRV